MFRIDFFYDNGTKIGKTGKHTIHQSFPLKKLCEAWENLSQRVERSITKAE